MNSQAVGADGQRRNRARVEGTGAVLIAGSAVLLATAVCVRRRWPWTLPCPLSMPGDVRRSFFAKLFGWRRPAPLPRTSSACGCVARDVSPRVVGTIAADQVLPLLALVIMSTDAWSYWNAGRLGAPTG